MQFYEWKLSAILYCSERGFRRVASEPERSRQEDVGWPVEDETQDLSIKDGGRSVVSDSGSDMLGPSSNMDFVIYPSNSQVGMFVRGL